MSSVLMQEIVEGVPAGRLRFFQGRRFKVFLTSLPRPSHAAGRGHCRLGRAADATLPAALFFHALAGERHRHSVHSKLWEKGLCWLTLQQREQASSLRSSTS